MIAQIETAIIEHLRSMVFGYAVPCIDSYGGQFDDGLAEVVRRLPGIWVVYAGESRPARMNTARDKWLVDATFVTMVGVKSLRGEPSTRHGLTINDTVREVGSYQMIRDVRAALLRQDFELGIDPLEPGSVKTLFNTRLDGQALSVFALEWHTKYVLAKPVADDGDLQSVALDYHLTPGGTTAAAAQDLIVMEDI